MDHLYALYRKDDESLRNYANRFWDLYEEVKADEASKVDTFKNGLRRDSSLYESLVLHPPATVQALAERVEKYIVLEEFRSRPRADEIDKKGSKPRTDKDSGRTQDNRGRRRGRDRDSRQETKKDRRRSGSRDRKGNGRPDHRSSDKPADRTSEQVGVIFTKPLNRIMEDIKGEPFFRRPKPMFGDSSFRRKDLYCDYHEDHGHRTKDCNTLRKHLQDLAEEGHLSEYVKDGKRKREEGDRRPEKRRADRAASGDTIDTIHGVVHRSKATQSAMRSTVSRAMMIERSMHTGPDADPVTVRTLAKGEEPLLSFSDADLAGVELPHSDPLVIKARIDVNNVKRILVDPGSSTDIMYKNLYDRMKGVKLNKVGHPVYSFSGQPIWPLGTVTLNVKLGPVSVPVDFVVVDVEAPFNAILGRSWLGAMRAVPSTYHQKLKFVAPEGIVTVRGSQSAARECFRNAISSSLSEKRPTEEKDVDTQLAEAAKFNQTLATSEGKGPDSNPKRKASDLDHSKGNKQKVAE